MSSYPSSSRSIPRVHGIAQGVNAVSVDSLVYMTYDHFDSDTQVFDGRVHDFKIGIPVADRKRPCANYDCIPAFRGISTFHIGSPKGRRLDSYIRLFRWAKQHGYRMENWSVEDWLIRPLTTATPVTGVTLGHRLIPVQNVGIYVPAGRYPLPSTALMLTIPAKVAGVEKVVACSPAFKGAFIWRLAIILMFRDVPLEGTAKVVYFVFLNVIFWFSGTMCVIPHSSLGADLTDDYNGHNKLRTFAAFGLNIGMLIATGVTLMVVSFFQNLTDGTEKSGWAYTALVYGLIVNKLGKKATMTLGLVIYGAAYLIVQFLPLNYTTAVLNAVLVGAAIMLRYGMDKKAYTTPEAAYEKKQKGEAYDLGEYAGMIR